MFVLLRFILLILPLTTVRSLFCSAYCAANQCKGVTSSDCTGCEAPFYINGSKCDFDTSSQYQIVAEEADITLSNTRNENLGSYSFNGWYLDYNYVYLTYTGAANVPHYAIRLIMWAITQDTWASTDYFSLQLTDISTFKYVSIGSFDTSEDLSTGSLTSPQCFYRIDEQFSHTTSLSSIRFQITTSTTYIEYFGFKEYMFLIRKCHDYCEICSSGLNTDCTQCVAPYMLSGNTCEVACQPNYGITSNATLCVLCDSYCLQCAYISTNCTVCQPNGTYESYLYSSSCVITCPVRYVQSSPTHTCQPCTDSDCLQCEDDFSTCYDCDTKYWFNYQCLKVCPDGYFQDISNCTVCDSSCSKCDGDPSPCSQCTVGNYLYNSACGVCPNTHFAHVPTRVCRDCATYCVTATLSIELTSTPSVRVYVVFSQNVDFNSIDYQNLQTISLNDSKIKLTKFSITYDIVNSKSYSITLEPTGMIQLVNVQFSVQTKNPNTDYYSSDYNKFSQDIYSLNDSLVWSYLKGPEPSDEQAIVIQNIDFINDEFNSFFGQQYVQQIKKTGVLAFFLPGAQISSSAILHNGKPAQNMYEITRFWGSFVFFEVPSWEEDASQTKYMFSQKVSDILNSTSSARLLQTTNTSNKPDYWRFVRTGHTTYFVFDTYMQLALLVLCWVIVLVLHLLKGKCPKVVGPGYTLLHRVHEVVVFYIWVGALLEWLAFQSQSAYKEVSLAISVVAALYFLCYELYVFYRLIPYPFVELGSRKFAFYVERYSFFLRDLRYEEYKHLAAWSFRHLLRPYNYQILSFFRLLMVLAALPLFADFTHGAISCLVAIQFLEIVRFLLTWPFYALWRNIYRLVMEIALLVFFTLYLVDDVLVTYFFQNVNSITQEEVNLYYTLGWIGFSFIMLYNIGFILYFIGDIIYGCCYSNRERMEIARRNYYRELLQDYEAYETLLQKQQHWKVTEHRSSYLKMLNSIQDVQVVPAPTNKRRAIEMIVKKGNLQEKDFDKLQTIQVKIEQYEIRQTFESNEYQVSYIKVPSIFMHINPQVDKKDNIFIPERKKKVFRLNRILNIPYYVIVDHLFKKYSSVSAQAVVLKTFAKVDQSLYEPGIQIPVDSTGLTQYIEVKYISKTDHTERLNNILPGFPIPTQLLEQL